VKAEVSEVTRYLRTSKIEESWFRAGLTFLGSKRANGFLWLWKESGFGWVDFLGKWCYLEGGIDLPTMFLEN
jgi:hypothetical protein